MLHRVVGAAVVAVVVVAVVAGGGGRAPAPLAPDLVHAQAAAAKYAGAASCGASNCHGSSRPRAEYPKLNEATIWSQKDHHARAYTALTSEKAKSISPSKIASNLKLGKPETSERCLTCHAVNVKPELRGPKFDIAEGVQCEGCHGSSEKWLEQHSEKGWTHEQSVKVGMYDTKNILLRAEKCVSCHLQIDADMVAAGHPDLSAFELDTYSGQMPPHWRDKGTWAGTKAWATGQVIALREAAKQLGDRAGGSASGQVINDALGKVQGHGAMVRVILAIVAPDAQKSVEGDVATLTDAVAKGDKAKIGSTAKSLQTTTQAQAPKVAARDYDQASTKKLLADISGSGDAIGATGLRAAEQAAMALDRLYSTYSKAPGAKPDPAASKALDTMFGTLEDPKKYDAKAFGAAAKSFNDTIK
jgi:hypothetical protein